LLVVCELTQTKALTLLLIEPTEKSPRIKTGTKDINVHITNKLNYECKEEHLSPSE